MERDFSADAPDRLWVADVTYVPIWAGFLFLAVVVDAFSRRVVGWSMANHMRTARRVHIPKEGARDKTRPIGIPTLEDKVLQCSVLMALEPVYEQDFLECSYGFRPGRSAHLATHLRC